MSSWIRDYLYLPLTGDKFGRQSTGGLEVAVTQNNKDVALFATWIIMGLWHGANWTFVIWGLYHSAVIFISRKISVPFGMLRESASRRFLGCVVTIPVMMLGWIPFRAESVDQAFDMLYTVFDISLYGSLGMRENVYLITALLMFGFVVAASVYENRQAFLSSPISIRVIGNVLLYTILLTGIFIFLRPVEQFIYFQF